MRHLFILLCVVWSFTFAQDTQITILHSNDCHGHVLPFDIAGQQKVGGISPRMTYIKKIREKLTTKKQHLLLLDAGDLNTGDPFSDMLKGEPAVRIMNKMRYDAMAVGNHEFDLRLEDLLQQQKLAKFPYLSANVVYKDTQKLIFPPYIIIQKGDIKIGIFGMTTDDTPIVSTYGNDSRLQFLKHEVVIPKMIRELRPQVDFLIGVFHISLHQVVHLCKQFPGMDIVIGGHSHIITPEPIKVGKTLIAEAGSYGLLMGKFDLTFRNKKLVKWKHRNVGINLKSPIMSRGSNKVAVHASQKILDLDKEVEKIFQPYRQKVGKLLDEPLGVATKNFKRGRRHSPQSSTIGNLISDALRERTRADIALHNVGGIRADILKGNITYRDVKRVLPFSNSLYIYTLKGKDVLKILQMMADFDPTTGRFFEVSGLKFHINRGKIHDVFVGKKKLEKEKTYTLAVNSFIAQGGDGFSVFKELSQKVDTSFLLCDVLCDYIRERKIISPDRTARFTWKTSGR
ncbi:bifunctional metallophosphatase/5'-nucleotidase [Candidatus Uabimicrobium amorphum]|uniref:Bifunctional UDP-sugarhydrolase/5'-nucleotidase n=1 Tax=Uabimicrobium amorphum TaxID=2596890 RepID=A0A5S9IN73_UABAM|nr:5'-nucleotidase C-terminal domain-containing protein [Candidatus Uabimicrobium amorphum]BBM84150.1 bifunctional UDP-sugarhydrolase/5'-nucleotidase [Candidatus Uabimicrobium amorphum]